ncbi:MAG: hypothetical protein HRT73_05450, partial [Flavobacteriales bacterium]|nr:hypothetical protein [Flavobacteriales bacterium]
MLTVNAVSQKKFQQKWSNGNLKLDGFKTRKGYKDGAWKEYYQSGKIKLEEKYQDGKRVGKSTGFHENGEKKHEGIYILISRANGDLIGYEYVSRKDGPWKE